MVVARLPWKSALVMRRQHVQLQTGEFTARPRPGLFDILPGRLPLTRIFLYFSLPSSSITSAVTCPAPARRSGPRARPGRVARGELLDHVIGKSFGEGKSRFPSLIDERVFGCRQILRACFHSRTNVLPQVHPPAAERVSALRRSRRRPAGSGVHRRPWRRNLSRACCSNCRSNVLAWDGRGRR